MPESSAQLVSILDQFGEFAVLSLLLMILFGLIMKLRSQERLQKTIQQRLEDLHSETSSYGQSLINMRTLLTDMDTRISDFTRHNLEIQSQFAFNRSFEEASRLIREGGTVESLISDCGLSDAEASLMIRLHGNDPEKPRQQWKQVPLAEADDTGEELVGEEIRLRETIRTARGGSR